MTDGPKAINTTYNGYRFRSRLEARWAVAMDAMGVAYEYEVQGFRLNGGKTLYLPDFYLPNQSVWVEIKGQPMLAYDETWEKARALAAETEECVIVLSGQITTPDNTVGRRFYGYETRDVPEQQGPDNVWWLQCPICKQCWLERAYEDLPCRCLPESPNVQPVLVDALQRARQARFEYGETPRPPRS